MHSDGAEATECSPDLAPFHRIARPVASNPDLTGLGKLQVIGDAEWSAGMDFWCQDTECRLAERKKPRRRSRDGLL